MVERVELSRLRLKPTTTRFLDIVWNIFHDLFSQEFFQDIDSFVAQSEFHHSQLESTLQPLLGHRDWLLGYGKGAKQLLESVVEGIRDGYRAVEEQVSGCHGYCDLMVM